MLDVTAAQNTKCVKCLALLASLLLTACSAPSGISDKTRALETPDSWYAGPIDSKGAHPKQSSPEHLGVDNWLVNFDDTKLLEIVNYALQHNHELKAKLANLEISRQQVDISDASNFPELSLALSSSRQKQVNGDFNNYQSGADISLDLSYEVDLWGQLSDEQVQSQLNYSAAQAQYQYEKITLVANIAKVWFDFTESYQLLRLYQQRSDNLRNNLSIIQASYRLGLSDALDVYLTQNDVSRELARIAEQKQKMQEDSRRLELLLGDYPTGKLKPLDELPLVSGDFSTGLPAQLLTRRLDIQASWYELMALDAGLAVAHKQKFPRFSLNASTGHSSDQLENLLDSSAMAWSLVGNLTIPLFNAGRLAALEEQARLRVVQKEQEYLQNVYQAFAEVEDQISNRSALTEQYQYYLHAQENALAAEDLSFNQYIKGLVSYTSVLESQRRAFDTQTTVIQLKNQLLQNRILVYQALGGNYDTSAKASDILATEPNSSTISARKNG